MYSPDKLTIETPEQIPLEFPLAGIGSRFLAIALDMLIQVLGWLLLIAFVLYAGYYALFEIFWNGQTPGKRLVRIRVIGDSGRPITVYNRKSVV